LTLAKGLYTVLFGWKINDDSMGEGMGPYTLIGGMNEMRGPQLEGARRTLSARRSVRRNQTTVVVSVDPFTSWFW